MLDLLPASTTEPEGYLFSLYLQGAGTGTPVRVQGRYNYTITRTAVGKLTITFADDPGPVFMGIAGIAFGDATTANVLGWECCWNVYTPPSGGGSVPATLTITIGNATAVVSDLSATSFLALQLQFKRAATDL